MNFIFLYKTIEKAQDMVSRRGSEWTKSRNLGFRWLTNQEIRSTKNRNAKTNFQQIIITESAHTTHSRATRATCIRTHRSKALPKHELVRSKTRKDSMNQSQMPTTQPGKNLCHVKTRRKEPILEEKTAKGEKVRDLGVATRALFSCDDRTAAVDGGARRDNRRD